MFKQQKGKNSFLLKKNQEKKKLQDQQKNNGLTVKLQKNIRAFLDRQKIINKAVQQRQIRFSILMNSRLEAYSKQQLLAFLKTTMNQAQSTKNFYLSSFIVDNLERAQFSQYCLEVMSQPENEHLRDLVIKNNQFLRILKHLLGNNKAYTILNLTIKMVAGFGILNKIEAKMLADPLLLQFQQNYVQIETAFGSSFNGPAIEAIVQHLFNKKYSFGKISLTALSNLTQRYFKIINSYDSIELLRFEPVICYMLTEYLSTGLQHHQQVILGLIKDNQLIISLIEDEEMLDEMENKMRQSQYLQDFTNHFLMHMKNIMTCPFILRLYSDYKFVGLNKVLLKLVSELTVLFEDRRLIFIRQLISSDQSLQANATSKDPMFFQGLKMKLLPMDDHQFKKFNIFTTEQWQTIITNCVSIADIKIQKQNEKVVNNNTVNKLTPFKKRNSDELQLKTIIDLLTNLYKKVLRTNKFAAELFLDYNISATLHNFLFGKGARRIQQLLRHLPFIFTFQSRMQKLKQFIKNDKKNHDRSLFLQQQVDSDLIIAVRRGKQFLDAFQTCMNRDLRKKYKIIFFNQQGLEQQGVDGGGIIKQFINRVLRDSFSQQYGLFMETSLNQIVPNPNAIQSAQYEFVGKLVGKAVYEGINIEQKFAEPFLNLVIGRQNTFQDMQFIDPEVYKGLLSIKHSSEDISQLQQTFVIYDQLPNGQKKYVDLLCPGKSPTNKQVFVTNENKMQFILSYADFKCNKQIEQKTRLFRRGFLKVMKPQWLTMFSNQQLNQIISGAHPDFNEDQMRSSTVYQNYHQKDQTIILLWQVLNEMTCEQKSLFLLFATSCSRPPTLGFQSMKPKICISKDDDVGHLPTANTCMNVLRLPNYKNKALLKAKLLYAINAKAGFEFA